MWILAILLLVSPAWAYNACCTSSGGATSCPCGGGSCFCVSDDGGPDDFHGQLDVTQFCQAGQPPTSGKDGFILYYVSFSHPTLSGSNSDNYCAILNVNNDASHYIDKALCVATTQTGGTFAVVPSWFNCSDTKTGKCFQSTPWINAPTTNCTASDQSTDPFTCGSDLVVVCNITIPATNGLNLFSTFPVNICSSSSASATSNPFDCIFSTCKNDAECGGATPCLAAKCTAGVCSLSPVVCNDNNGCTQDTCNASSGCVFTPVSELASNPCAGSIPCVNYLCNSSAAYPGCYQTTNDAACDDGNHCTTDTCNVLSGCHHTDIICADNLRCTLDSCVPGTGCVFTPLACPDCGSCFSGTCVENAVVAGGTYCTYTTTIGGETIDVTAALNGATCTKQCNTPKSCGANSTTCVACSGTTPTCSNSHHCVA